MTNVRFYNLFCLLITLVGSNSMLAMESPFFTSGTTLASSSASIDLKNAYGKDVLKGIVKRRGLEQANLVYGGFLQRLASALYTQDCFFYAIADFVRAERVARDFRVNLAQVLSAQQGHTVGLPEEGGQFALMPVKITGRRNCIIALQYRDLYLCGKQTEIVALMPELKMAVAALAAESDPELLFLRTLLQSKVEAVGVQSIIDRSTAQVKEWFSVLAKQGQDGYFPFKPTESQAGDFIAKQLELVPSLSLSDLMHDDYKRSKLLEAYKQRRGMYQELYRTAIAELNSLVSSPAIEQAVCYRLENPTQLLPGIELTHSLPVATSSAAMPEDFAADALSIGKAPGVKNKKKKKKTKAAVMQDLKDTYVQESLPGSSVQKTVLVDDGLVLASETMSPSPQNEQLSIEVIADRETDFVRSWLVYEVFHKNTLKIPLFEYSKNVSDWHANAESALREQGYYDPLSEKYKRAYHYARYQNDVVMHAHMKAYHAFPLEIDKYLAKFGRIEKRIIKTSRGSVHEGVERIFITMVGEMQQSDGSPLRGLYCYIIDPVTGVCYHRMFEPVVKNIFDPTFYDIYFIE